MASGDLKPKAIRTGRGHVRIRSGRSEGSRSETLYLPSAKGWGVLVTRLEQKAPGRVEQVNAAYTSQRCHACGYTAAESRESQARFGCRSCGHTAHADLHAARNIAAGHAGTARGGPACPAAMLRAAFRSACAVWPQDRQTKRAWLSRDSAAVYPQAWHRCDVYAALTCSTRPGAFCSSRVTSTPQPLSRNGPVQAGFRSDVRTRRVPRRVPRRVDGALGRAGHVAHPQVLDPDQVEAPGEVGGELAHPVLAGVAPADVPARPTWL